MVYWGTGEGANAAAIQILTVVAWGVSDVEERKGEGGRKEEG